MAGRKKTDPILKIMNERVRLLEDIRRLLDEEKGMARPAEKVGAGSDDTAPDRPIDEILEAYPGEWVLIRVIRIDEQGAMSSGQVVEHSPRRTKITRAVKRLYEQEPQARTHVDRGGRRMSADEFWRHVGAAVDRPYVNARW